MKRKKAFGKQRTQTRTTCNDRSVRLNESNSSILWKALEHIHRFQLPPGCKIASDRLLQVCLVYLALL